MIARRNLVVGLACVASAAAANALKPRHLVSLMPPGKKLSNILPVAVDGWISRDVSDMVAPETPDSLSARLYGETVGRVFRQESSGDEVMMLIAHGDVQSNELQLHRPEVCYPAFGYTITESAAIPLQLGRSISIPGRRLVAASPSQNQAVVYWTRLGEFFPTTVTEQRLERLETAIEHYIADGLLARFSMPAPDPAAAFAVLKGFIPKLVTHVAPSERRALIGTARAASLARLQ